MFRLTCAAGLAAMLLLGGCVVSEQQLRSQRELLDVKQRLSETERSLKLLMEDRSAGLRERVDQLSSGQADLRAGLDGLRVDMQTIQGRFDDQQRANEDLRQELTLSRDELGLQIADLQHRLSTAPPVPAAQLPAHPPAAAPDLAPAAGNPPPQESPTPVAETAAGLYQRALLMIRDLKDFSGGRELMETFLKRYPQDPLRVNAAYWIGETHYAEQRYDLAVLRFEDVIQHYPDHPKVASALLKQGLAFDALGDRTNARLQLQRVITQFPLAEEANIATQKLAEWGN